MQEYSSKLLENTVNQIAKLPGIGKRTAIRLALHLLKQSKEEVALFTSAIDELKNNIHFCKHCFNISDAEICEICANPSRDKSLVCVVQDIRDVIAIESTLAYKGVYHILGGVIDPLNGINVTDLNINTLIERPLKDNINEIFMALPATTEGDTTAYYICKHIKNRYPDIKITTIARGIAVGNELENTDEITLIRSILHRVDFDTNIR